MNHCTAAETESTLKNLCARPAARFGAALLAQSNGPTISFRQFVHTARQLVQEDQQGAATWLAALIALEMHQERRHQPRNSDRPSCN